MNDNSSILTKQLAELIDRSPPKARVAAAGRARPHDWAQDFRDPLPPRADDIMRRVLRLNQGIKP